MTYLEQIKELTDDGNFDTCTGPYPVSRDSMKEVWRIVEEMQAEIKALKIPVSTVETNIQLGVY